MILKKILVISVLSLMTSTVMAAPTLYGEADISLDYMPEKNATKPDRDVWKVNSNSVVLGLKGEEKLTERLNAIYAIEWGVSGDGDGSDLSQRDRFVGLKDSQFGTLKIGKHDTPVKKLSSPIDIFNTYVYNKADVAGLFAGENRLNNIVQYESPTFKIVEGNLKVNALFATGESSGMKSGNVDGRGFGNAWSASALYDNPLLVLGLGYDKAVPSVFMQKSLMSASDPEITGGTVLAAANTLRLISRVNPLEGVAIKAMYQTSEVENVAGNDAAAANIDDTNGWLLGGEYVLPNANNWTIKAQYSQNTTGFKDNTSDFKGKQIMTGLDYNFNKQAKVYGHMGYAMLEQGQKDDKQLVVGGGVKVRF